VASGREAKTKVAGPQRLAVLALSALLILLFVSFAIAQGIGQPGVPSGDVAKVQNAPDDLAAISEEQFDHAMEQQAAQARLKKTPPAGSKKYEEMKETALGELLDRVWIKGEAEELGITVTDEEIEDELTTIKKQNFGSDKAYKKFLSESKFTQEDVDDRVELQVLTNKIQERINEDAPKPSDSEIEAYYEANKSQFSTPASRDVRVVINKDKGQVEAAKKALEEDHSAASWEKVAAKYSSDPTSKSKGGLQEGITDEFVKGPLKNAIFGVPVGELSGPVQYETNWILIEVVKINSEDIQPLDEAEPQISSTLGQEKQQAFFSEFISNYQAKWASRTFCADDYLIERCANYTGSGHPKNAAPGCYEADPDAPVAACPAPVQQNTPALPGTTTLVKPEGERLPQRPHPAGANAAGSSEAPEAVPSVPNP
jgi:foldase protein PrsA